MLSLSTSLLFLFEQLASRTTSKGWSSSNNRRPGRERGRKGEGGRESKSEEKKRERALYIIMAIQGIYHVKEGRSVTAMIVRERKVR